MPNSQENRNDPSVRALLELLHPEAMFLGTLSQSLREMSPDSLHSILRVAKTAGVLLTVLSLFEKYGLKVNRAEDGEIREWWTEYEFHSERISRFVDTSGTLISRLREQGLAYAMIKGIALATHYPKGILRPQGDIDLLVRETDAQSVETLLNGMGFSQGIVFRAGLAPEPFTNASKEWYRESNPHLAPFVRVYGDQGLAEMVEVHVRLSFAFQPFHYNVDEMLGRTVSARFRGLEFMTLNPTDNLIFLCGHLYHDNTELHMISDNLGRRLYRILDIALHSLAYRSDIDWDNLVEIATKKGTIVPVDWCLRVIEELFPGSLPLGHLGIPEFVRDYHRNAVRFGYATGTWDKFSDWPQNYVDRVFSRSADEMATELHRIARELGLRIREEETSRRREWIKRRKAEEQKRSEMLARMNSNTIMQLIELASNEQENTES